MTPVAALPTRIVAAALLLALAVPAGPHAAAGEDAPAGAAVKPDPEPEPDLRADLLAERTSVQPGGRAALALRLVVPKGWHVYWRNPGDAGTPPEAKWKLPDGWRAAPLAFPVPVRHEEGPIVTFVHEGEVLLPVEIEVPKTAAAGTEAEVSAEVSALVCADVCVPVKRTVRASLRVADAESAADPATRDAFAAARRSLPGLLPKAPARAARLGTSVVLFLDGTGVPLPDDARVEFFPSDDGVVTLDAARREGTRVVLTARPRKRTAETKGGASGARLRGVLAVRTKTATSGYEIDAEVAPEAVDDPAREGR